MAIDSTRELIVMVKPEAGVRVGWEPTSTPSMTGGDVQPLTDSLTYSYWVLGVSLSLHLLTDLLTSFRSDRSQAYVS